MIQIGFGNEIIPRHPLTMLETINALTAEKKGSRQTISMLEYLKQGGVRKTDHTRHQEYFVVNVGGKIQELSLEEIKKQIFLQSGVEILGLSRIGNSYQNVTASIQGYNPILPQTSEFERPNVSEGPHMVLGLYAFDPLGKLRIFRTLQLRNEQIHVDTIRGFADSTTLDSGQVLYDIEHAEDQILKNIYKVVKDEGGTKLKIKNIIFLGSPVVNSSFVTSLSATFAIEVDYQKFRTLSQVKTTEELIREEEAFKHEGLTSFIIDMSFAEYIGYKLDPSIIRDLTADGPSDAIVNYYIARTLINTL